MIRLLLFVALAQAGCKSSPKGILGVEPWLVGKSTLDETRGKGVCTEEKQGSAPKPIFRCVMLNATRFGVNEPFKGFKAQTQLTFHGSKADTPLAELQLSVLQCDQAQMESWITDVFGDPIASRADGKTRMQWTSGDAHIQLYMGESECILNFVHKSDEFRIKQLKSAMAR